ncbi:MAG: oligosaccharide flippase family protein [Deltaproteobacteria bacterium]|nr:oligosaccharide flippase family protein [Deltaproteobacteria bacterium]
MGRKIFGRDVVTLVSGTVAAQALLIGAVPILSRIFAPSAFGLFAVYSMLMSLCAYVVSGRYELAVVIPQDDADAASLVRIAMRLGALGAMVLFAVALVARRPLATILGQSELSPWLLLLPASVWFTVATQTLNLWFARIEQFRAISTNRILVALSTTVASLAFGWLGWRSAGLLLGLVLGQAIGVAAYAAAAAVSMRERGLRSDSARMRLLMRRYSDFPRYSVVADAIGFAGGMMPVLLMGPTFGGVAVGHYSLTQRMLGAPSGLVGNAFAEVFRQRASRELAESGNCRETWKQTARELLIVGVPLFLIVVLIGPGLAPRLLGSKWAGVGPFVSSLGVLYAISFVASPLGRTLQFGEKQRTDLGWQVVLFLLTTSAIVFGCQTRSLLTTLWTFVLAYSSMYVVYLVLSYRAASRMTRRGDGEGAGPTTVGSTEIAS